MNDIYVVNRTRGSRVKNDKILQYLHDLRAPLLSAKVILNNLNHVASEDRLILQHSIARIERLTQSLQQTEQALDRMNFNELNDILSNVVKEAYVGASKSITFDFESTLAGTNCFINCSKLELQRAVANLLQNSIDAVTDRGNIKLSLSSSDGFINIKVSDNGCGMTQKTLAVIMRRGGTFNKPSGQGLGLQQVKNFVHQSRGGLDIFSKLGEGTTVQIKIKFD